MLIMQIAKTMDRTLRSRKTWWDTWRVLVLHKVRSLGEGARERPMYGFVDCLNLLEEISGGES